ncbi:MAG: hypothetical protein KC713_06085, partial [Candidatus Omnitrophica bacterium]|nr:hypothetical protein [Candidatus Omnitrophota bacterium]
SLFANYRLKAYSTNPKIKKFILSVLGQAINNENLKRAYFSDPIPDQNQLKSKTLGGIDLNPDQMMLKESGDRVDFKVNPWDPDQAIPQFDGLVPVIIQMTPVTNLPMLLGFTDREDYEALSYSLSHSERGFPQG